MKIKKARHVCTQEAEIAVLREMARINSQDHAEMKTDLKLLIGFRWKTLAATSVISLFVSATFTVLIAYFFGR